MQSKNALAEIQQRYAGCNLLMPASTEVQLIVHTINGSAKTDR